MNTRLLFAFIVICGTLNAQSPDWAWAQRSGNSDNDIIKSVAADASGSVIGVGYFSSSSIVFGSNTLTNAVSGLNDLFIVKYNDAGDVLWAKSFGGDDGDYALAVSVDDSGNAYVGGYFKSHSIVFGSTTLTNPSFPYGDVFLVKLDPSGNILWAKRPSASVSSDAIYAVCADHFGNVYATGHFEGSSITFGSTKLTNANSPNQDAFIVKYNSAGVVQWAKSAGKANDDVGNSVTVDATGNVIVGGQFASASISFGSSTLNNANSGTFDVFIVKYDAAGNVLWAKGAGDIENDYALSVSADRFDNVYAAGYFRSDNISFGSESLTNSGPPYGDMFLVKYNADGNDQWARRASESISSDAINSVCVDTSGGVYVTGHFQSSDITFGSTTLNNSNSPKQEIFVAKYDDNGNSLWAKGAGSDNDEVGNSIAANNSGSIFIGGQFSSSTVSFGSTDLINANEGFDDLYLAKLAGTEGTKELTSGDFNIYPNPFSAETTIQTNTTFKDATLVLYNSIGQMVRQINHISEQPIQLQRGNLPEGLYLIQLKSDDKIYISEKLVIVNE